MNAVLFDLGFIKIYWYSMMFLCGFLIGGFLAFQEANKWNFQEDEIVDMFFYMIPIALIGARIYFVLFHFSYYSAHLDEIIKVWEGGLAIHGGIIAALLWIFYYSKKHHLNMMKLLDILIVSLLLGQAIGRWGNFFNGEAHGGITTLEQLKWLPSFIQKGMYINGNYYIPTFLYESIWCFIGFLISLLLRKKPSLKLGQLTSFYLIWYGIGRFVIESMRTDSLMLGNIRMAQLVSSLMVFIGIILYMNSKSKNLYHEKERKNESI